RPSRNTPQCCNGARWSRLKSWLKSRTATRSRTLTTGLSKHLSNMTCPGLAD
ncbi:hypothetical protein IWW43_006569, partial [Coemansia sp. RSA 1935]